MLALLLLLHDALALRPSSNSLGRRPLVHLALASAAVGSDGSASHAAVVAPDKAQKAAPPTVTQKVFLDLRIITRFDVEVLEDAAVRGRLVCGLYGKDAALGAERFVDFVRGTVGQFRDSGDGPSYRSSGFERISPGELLEGGRIAGLQQEPFAGVLEYQFRSRLLPLRPLLEANELRHQRRGLITRRLLEAGPEFGVTLGPAPRLDGGWEVIGEVLSGGELLEQIEALPFVTGKSLEEPGSVADEVFKAQKKVFSSLSKGLGDTRAKDRTGQLLRRVEITNCGLL